MYTYILKINFVKTAHLLNQDDLENAIKLCNSTAYSMRYSRQFSIIGPLLIQIKSREEVKCPERCVSSITRILYKINENYRQMTYNNSLLNAKLIKGETQSITYISDIDASKLFLDILFGSEKSNKNKELNRNTKEEVKKILINYLNKRI